MNNFPLLSSYSWLFSSLNVFLFCLLFIFLQFFLLLGAVSYSQTNHVKCCLEPRVCARSLLAWSLFPRWEAVLGDEWLHILKRTSAPLLAFEGFDFMPCTCLRICICNHNEDVDPTRGRLPRGSCGRSRLEMERWLDTENVPPITNG